MPPRRRQPVVQPRPPRPGSLGEACRSLALDAHGMRCPVCPLKVWCTTETRWRVPREPRPRHLV